jgi:hypothetical protein
MELYYVHLGIYTDYRIACTEEVTGNAWVFTVSIPSNMRLKYVQLSIFTDYQVE